MFSWFIMGSQLMLGPKAAVCSSLWLIRPWSLLKKTEIRLKSYKFQWNIKHNAQDSHTLFSCLTNSPLYTQLNFRFALSFFLLIWMIELLNYILSFDVTKPITTLCLPWVSYEVISYFLITNNERLIFSIHSNFKFTPWKIGLYSCHVYKEFLSEHLTPTSEVVVVRDHYQMEDRIEFQCICFSSDCGVII